MDDNQAKPRIAFARNKARLILKELKIDHPPILLKTILPYLQKTQEIKVLPFDLGQKISGIQATEGSTSYISYNLTQHQHRQRFTVAHEFGHLALGHTSANNSDYNLDTKDPYEIEANNFAAELLIPLEMIKKDYVSVHDPVKLARMYLVSQEAMWTRLMECHLI